MMIMIGIERFSVQLGFHGKMWPPCVTSEWSCEYSREKKREQREEERRESFFLCQLE